MCTPIQTEPNWGCRRQQHAKPGRGVTHHPPCAAANGKFASASMMSTTCIAAIMRNPWQLQGDFPTHERMRDTNQSAYFTGNPSVGVGANPVYGRK